MSSTTDGASPVDYGIEKTTVHEDYSSQTNDIALIRLDRNVVFTGEQGVRKIFLFAGNILIVYK